MQKEKGTPVTAPAGVPASSGSPARAAFLRAPASPWAAFHGWRTAKKLSSIC